MINHEQLTAHLKILETFNPQLASLIQQLPSKPFVSFPSYEKENEELFQTLMNLDPQVLYIYGLGTGYFYQVAKSWLQAGHFRYLVFLEDDLEVIQNFLQMSEATEILNDSSVEIHYLQTQPFDHLKVREIVSNFILRNSSLGTLPAIKEEKKTEWFNLKEAMDYELAEHVFQDAELANYGLAFYKSFYHNLLQLPFAYLGDHLKDRFKNIPAIICGAGESLNQKIPFLKELKERALIFAPGSSLNVLSYAGIYPHFGVAIDPTPDSFHRLIMHRAFETPIFYFNRLYYEALTTIHGPRLFINGATFYRTVKWFEKELQLDPLDFEDGCSVTHETVEIARILGCNPIIFVGLDLSQKDQHYAPGVERHPLFPTFDNKSHLGQPIQVLNIKGENVWSYWAWIIEAQWFELYQKRHPEIQLINATEEGIGLFSIPNQSLKELTETVLTKKQDFDKQVHEAIQSIGKVPVSMDTIIEKINVFKESLERCLQMLKDKKWNDSFKQEIGYQFDLQQFEEFFERFVSRDRQKIQRMLDQEAQEYWSAFIQQELETFLFQTATLHLKAIENALKKIPIADQINAQVTNYYASGAVYSERLENGTERFYYESGQLKSEIPYISGQLSGYVRLYYPNGQLKRELFFNKGKREGLERSWYENGQLFTEVNQGHWARSWSEDGVLVREVKE